MTADPTSGAARQVSTTLTRLNECWLEGRVDRMEPYLHPDVVMVLPGFTGRARGREEVLGGFREMVETADVRSFDETDRQVDVVGDTGVVSFAFDMVYAREGEAWRSTGRDLWVFRRAPDGWRAVWRVLLEREEEPVAPPPEP